MEIFASLVIRGLLLQERLCSHLFNRAGDIPVLGDSAR